MVSKAAPNPLASSRLPALPKAPTTRANAGKIESTEPARRLVGEFVGQAFYGVLMKQMHESSLKSELMHGGRGEEAFQAQLNMEMAGRMGRASGDPIAERIYRSFEKHLRAKGWKPGERAGAAEDRT